MSRKQRTVLLVAILFAGSTVAAAAESGAWRTSPANDACADGKIPVCTSHWNWDCIEGDVVVFNHCDVNDVGCMIEDA